MFTIIISYTNIIPVYRAKLLCYTALSGVVLVAHAGEHPFDDRKNKLWDRVEYQGLMARFATFLGIQLILVFNPRIVVAARSAPLLKLGNAPCVVTIWIHAPTPLGVLRTRRG